MSQVGIASEPNITCWAYTAKVTDTGNTHAIDTRVRIAIVDLRLTIGSSIALLIFKKKLNLLQELNVSNINYYY